MISKTESLEFCRCRLCGTKLRIPPVDPLRPTEGMEHDELISSQICAAVSFVSIFTDRPTVAELDHAALRSAGDFAHEGLYDGYRNIKRNAAMYSLMDPFRRLAG